MSATTRPFFVLSSGRSGSKMMEELLSAAPEVEIHHEYLCTHVQPLAVKRHLGLIDDRAAQAALRAWHGAAVRYSACRLWGDSSNKLSWLVDVLDSVFPEALFIHLVRDGRKVASSYFHKLADECYDERSVAILSAWLARPDALPEPPPEKRYWWPQPRPGTPLATRFAAFDRFARIAWHWAESNRAILDRLAYVPPERQLRIRLEDLVASPDRQAELFAFLDLPPLPQAAELLRRPHNVNTPVDRPLTPAQRECLMALAGDVMRLFGYDRRPEYAVEY